MLNLNHDDDTHPTMDNDPGDIFNFVNLFFNLKYQLVETLFFPCNNNYRNSEINYNDNLKLEV